MSNKEYWKQKYEAYFDQLRKPLIAYFEQKKNFPSRVSVKQGSLEEEQKIEAYNQAKDALDKSMRGFVFSGRKMDLDEVRFIYDLYNRKISSLLGERISAQSCAEAMLQYMRQNVFEAIENFESVEIIPTVWEKLATHLRSRKGKPPDEHLSGYGGGVSPEAQRFLRKNRNTQRTNSPNDTSSKDWMSANSDMPRDYLLEEMVNQAEGIVLNKNTEEGLRQRFIRKLREPRLRER